MIDVSKYILLSTAGRNASSACGTSRGGLQTACETLLLGVLTIAGHINSSRIGRGKAAKGHI